MSLYMNIWCSEISSQPFGYLHKH